MEGFTCKVREGEEEELQRVLEEAQRILRRMPRESIVQLIREGRNER